MMLWKTDQRFMLQSLFTITDLISTDTAELKSTKLNWILLEYHKCPKVTILALATASWVFLWLSNLSSSFRSFYGVEEAHAYVNGF